MQTKPKFKQEQQLDRRIQHNQSINPSINRKTITNHSNKPPGRHHLLPLIDIIQRNRPRDTNSRIQTTFPFPHLVRIRTCACACTCRRTSGRIRGCNGRQRRRRAMIRIICRWWCSCGWCEGTAWEWRCGGGRVMIFPTTDGVWGWRGLRLRGESWPRQSTGVMTEMRFESAGTCRRG